MSIRIISEPELPDSQRFPHPDESADKYRAGTIVEDERGARWRVYWDEQDHQLEWQRVKGYPRPVEESADSGKAGS